MPRISWRPEPVVAVATAGRGAGGRTEIRPASDRSFAVQLATTKVTASEGLFAPHAPILEVNMARPLCRARPTGFAALIALLGLTGCVYERPYGYGGYSDGGQYYGGGQYYDGGGQYYGNG
jgi:hypothetical protein